MMKMILQCQLFAGVLIAAASCLAAAAAPVVAPHIAPTSAAPANAPEIGTAAQPLVVRTAKETPNVDEAAHKIFEYHRKPFLDELTSWGTVVIAFVTAILAAFTYRLWSATSILALDAKRTSIAELRPYVGIETLKIVSSFIDSQGNACSKLLVQLRNFGRTPAYGVDYFHTAQRVTRMIPGEPLILDPLKPKFRDGPEFVHQVMYPGQQLSTEITLYPAFLGEKNEYPHAQMFFLHTKVRYFDPLSNGQWALGLQFMHPIHQPISQVYSHEVEKFDVGPPKSRPLSF